MFTPDFTSLTGLELPLFQKLVRRYAQEALNAGQLQPLQSQLHQTLTRPGLLMSGPTENLEWRWSWLAALVYRLANPENTAYTPDAARVAATLECLETAATLQRHYPVPGGTGPVVGALHGLALSLILAVQSRDQGSALIRHYNRLVNSLSLSLQEDVEQWRAEQSGEGVYVVAVGRKQATLAEGAAILAATAAHAPTSDLATWGKFGYSLGLAAQLAGDLELTEVGPCLGRLATRPLPLLYALTYHAEPEKLEEAWHAGRSQQLRELLQSGLGWAVGIDLAADWLGRAAQHLPGGAEAGLRPVLDMYAARLTALRQPRRDTGAIRATPDYCATPES